MTLTFAIKNCVPATVKVIPVMFWIFSPRGRQMGETNPVNLYDLNNTGHLKIIKKTITRKHELKNNHSGKKLPKYFSKHVVN